MAKILDIYNIPGKDMASIVIEGCFPKNLKIGSQIKKGDSFTVITSIPMLGQQAYNVENNVFGVVANSDNLKVGDDVEII